LAAKAVALALIFEIAVHFGILDEPVWAACLRDGWNHYESKDYQRNGTSGHNFLASNQ
jgi:hypothetical protein